MTTIIWTQRSGYNLGTFQERVSISINLPLIPMLPDDVTFSVISGKLPGGLRISGKQIIGTPYQIPRDETFTFCVRGSQGTNISDRSFTITVTNADGPMFATAAGGLPIGPARQMFTLDSTYVDFQIEVDDPNLSVGQHLSYFISRDDGKLPPGLVLTTDGRIVGFIQPAISIKPEDGSGTYDESFYDAVAFDFAYRPSNGYDSYIYDNVFYDFNLAARPPTKLNRNYQFNVTVTDGDVTVKRKFDIFVVGDNYFRADNEVLSGIFTADVTFLRAPIWLTASNLGTYRANNYITIPLQTYDTDNVINSLDALNPDNTASILPIGMQFDENTSEIYGSVPYQPAITSTYTFTITSTRVSVKGETASAKRTFTINIIGEIDSVIKWNTNSDLGSINANFVSTLKVNATSTVTDAIVLYQITSGHLPPGLGLDLDGEIVGKVNQYSTPTTLGLTTFDTVNTTFDGGTTTVDRVFTFTVKARDQYGISAVSRTFTILVSTPNQLVFSNIRVKPFLKLDQRNLWKDFINNTNIFTPKSIYRTNDANFGLQTDMSMVIYAGIETTAAAKYIGAIGLNHKRKRFQFGNVKTATAFVPGTTNAVYEVVYLEVIDPLEPNGRHLPNELKHLGTEDTRITSDSSTSFWTATLDQMMIDAPNLERPDPIVTVDSQGYFVSNASPNTYFPSSVSNWQERISAIGATERNYLPLWMRSIQPGSKAELGFKLAIPLCYCTVGASADIVLNIKHSGFNFSSIDYTVDRYIIDSVEGSTGDKYLVFRNDRITV